MQLQWLWRNVLLLDCFTFTTVVLLFYRRCRHLYQRVFWALRELIGNCLWFQRWDFTRGKSARKHLWKFFREQKNTIWECSHAGFSMVRAQAVKLRCTQCQGLSCCARGSRNIGHDKYSYLVLFMFFTLPTPRYRFGLGTMCRNGCCTALKHSL